MNFPRMAVAATALCLTLGTTVTLAAEASAPASFLSCITMAKKVKEALDANQQSPNADAARTAMSFGRDYCSNQRYDKGVASYARALQLLGAG
jgi:cytochrome c-type biogenesis protein CcmH/NrfG